MPGRISERYAVHVTAPQALVAGERITLPVVPVNYTNMVWAVSGAPKLPAGRCVTVTLWECDMPNLDDAGATAGEIVAVPVTSETMTGQSPEGGMLCMIDYMVKNEGEDGKSIFYFLTIDNDLAGGDAAVTVGVATVFYDRNSRGDLLPVGENQTVFC